MLQSLPKKYKSRYNLLRIVRGQETFVICFPFPSARRKAIHITRAAARAPESANAHAPTAREEEAAAMPAQTKQLSRIRNWFQWKVGFNGSSEGRGIDLEQEYCCRKWEWQRRVSLEAALGSRYARWSCTRECRQFALSHY